MSKEIISIQIPVFRAAFLEDAVLSILAQTNPNWELIILVDGPKQSELTEIDKILNTYKDNKRIKIVYQQNQGVGQARQRLFSLTKQNYIITLDDDDILAPNAVEEVLNFIAKEPDFSLLRAWRLIIDDKFHFAVLKIGAFIKAEAVKQNDFLAEQKTEQRLKYNLPVRFNPDQFFCLNKKYLNKIKIETRAEFLNIGENIDWIYKLNELKPEVYIDKVLYLKRQYAGNALNLLKNKQIEELENDYLLAALKRRKIAEFFVIKNGRPYLDYHYRKDLQIEITNNCNRHCLICPRENLTAKRGFMITETFKQIIEQAKRFYKIERVVLAGIGEPFLHPQIFDFSKIVKEHSGLELTIITNGQLLDKAKLDNLEKLNDEYLDLNLIFSLHSLTPQIYSQITGCNLAEIMANLKYSLKKNFITKIALVKNKLNQKEVEKLAKIFGNKLEISICQNVAGLLKNRELIDADFYQANDYQTRAKEPLCRQPVMSNFYIDWQGNFLPCFNDFTRKIVLGNIKKHDFEYLDKKIEKVLQTKIVWPICESCSCKYILQKENMNQYEIFYNRANQ